VGGIEALALIASAFQPKGAFCGAMQTLNGNLRKAWLFHRRLVCVELDSFDLVFCKWQRLDEVEVCVGASSRLESGSGVK